MGYSSQSKGYRVYNLQTKKMIIIRDVEFDENSSWNWEADIITRRKVMLPAETENQDDKNDGGNQTTAPADSPPESPAPALTPQQEVSSPESTPGKVRSLRDLYETCNFAFAEPESFEEAVKQGVWVDPMK